MVKKIIFCMMIAVFTVMNAHYSYTQALTGAPRDLDWKKINTEHFVIVFPVHLERYARKLTVITEKYYTILTNDQKWYPSGKTNVILTDSVDFSNGYSTPIPAKTVMMYLPSPQPEDSIGNFDNWLEILFIHEYTHTINLDTMTGFPVFLNYILGNIYYPNMFNPLWIIEGNAVYNESKYTKTGRLRSSYVNMVMRTDVLTDNFKSIAQASTMPRRWSKGMVPYLYGANFVKYLNDSNKATYGEFNQIFHINGSRWFPFQNYRNARAVYDVSFDTQWVEWQDYLTQKYTAEKKIIMQKELTKFTNITNTGYNTSSPRFISNNEIFFIRDNDITGRNISSYNIHQGAISKKTNIYNADMFTVSADESIYANETNLYSNTYQYKDIFRKGYFFDNRITTRGRVLYFDMYKNSFAYVSTDAGLYSINIINIDNPESKSVLLESEKQLLYCRFSPDGRKIAFCYRTNSGNGDTRIAYIDIATKEIISIDAGQSINIFPFWNKDSSSLFYSSDATGVYNLYQADLGAKKTYQLTNTLTGVFSGDISPDNSKIALTTYSEKGFDISLIDYPVKILAEKPFAATMLDTNFFKDNEVLPATESENYYSLLNIRLTNWLLLPWVSAVYDANDKIIKNDYFLFVAATFTDPLMQHNMLLYAYNFFGQKKTALQAIYYESSFYPDIMLSYSDDRIFWGKDTFPWGGDTNVYVHRTTERTVTSSVIFPFYDMAYSSAVQVFYSFGKRYYDSSYNGNNIHDTSQTANAGIMLLFDNTKLYGKSVASEKGISLTLLGDEYNTKIGSDLDIREGYFIFTAKLPSFFDNHVLSLGARGGYSDAENYGDYPFSLGAREKGTWDTYPLGIRGYPGDGYYGNRMAVATAEYILPIVEIDDSWSTIPVYFRKFWIKGFFEYGDVWTGSNRIMKRSAGAELYLTTCLSYSLDAELFCGYARGFDRYGEHQIYYGFKGLLEYTKSDRKQFNFYK